MEVRSEDFLRSQRYQVEREVRKNETQKERKKERRVVHAFSYVAHYGAATVQRENRARVKLGCWHGQAPGDRPQDARTCTHTHTYTAWMCVVCWFVWLSRGRRGRERAWVLYVV